jgi:hypothetical protein
MAGITGRFGILYSGELGTDRGLSAHSRVRGKLQKLLAGRMGRLSNFLASKPRNNVPGRYDSVKISGLQPCSPHPSTPEEHLFVCFSQKNFCGRSPPRPLLSFKNPLILFNAATDAFTFRASFHNPHFINLKTPLGSCIRSNALKAPLLYGHPVYRKPRSRSSSFHNAFQKPYSASASAAS